ncbi:hypothetical protein [Streptomyces sp. NPDC002133]|uniref:hypothetical protein n=1 Tax=Streptomyces sp. NPDC002133 TaxID=3154409 RepID=UPI0033283C40
MRLAHIQTPWSELEHARWLRRRPPHVVRSLTASVGAQLLDAAVLMQEATRGARLAAANWALHACSQPRTRHLSAPVRLAALALTAYQTADPARPDMEADRLIRTCALTRDMLTATLDRLAASKVIATWTFDPVTDDLGWVPPAEPDRS